MEVEEIVYEGVILSVFYTNIPEDEADLSVGYLGKDAYKVVEKVLVNGVDITALLEQHLETIEEKLNE